MAGIIGTVIRIQDLYEQKDTSINYGEGLEKTKLFDLKKDRKYIVPLFQREIRWQKGNLFSLVSDVKNKPKFLGNIILTKTNKGDYEILDGQQRSTIIYMLVNYIRNKYAERINVFNLCELEIESFKGFSSLFKHYFDMGSLTADEINTIHESDDYVQCDKYMDLWREISGLSVLKNVTDAEAFLKNLANCEVNVIVNIESEESGIESFLDVNLKGVKLDTEDIFKGYLCAQDNSREIHDIWSRLKKLDAKINPPKKQQVYPFMTIIEHFMRCKLLTNDLYKDIEFNTEFELVKEQEVEGKTYSQSTHLLSVIHNKTYLKECLAEIEMIMNLLSGMVNSAGTSDLYAAFVRECNDRFPKKKKVDDKERDIMFNLTKKIIRDKDKVPNCLLIKYFMDTLLNEKVAKKDLEKIYAVSTASLLFSIFETKKDFEIIKSIIKETDWYGQLCTYISSKISAQTANGKMISVIYNERKDGEDNLQVFRCKSLATLFDYYELKKGILKIKSGKTAELEEFLNNSVKYSIEHFIINDSGKIACTNAKGVLIEYNYPPTISKLKNTLLNYIFICETLNGAMQNDPFDKKLYRLLNGDLKEGFKKENSGYSKKIVDLARMKVKFPDVDSFETSEEYMHKMDEYFNEKFETQMLDYTKAVFEAMKGIL